jgi:hypothetical protein
VRREDLLARVAGQVSGISVSKARILEFRQSDDEIRQAVKQAWKAIGPLTLALQNQAQRLDRHYNRLEAHQQAINAHTDWLVGMSKVSVWRRLKWLLTGG